MGKEVLEHWTGEFDYSFYLFIYLFFWWQQMEIWITTHEAGDRKDAKMLLSGLVAEVTN